MANPINYLDQMGDMVRSLVRLGMPEDAAIAAARAAQNAPPAGAMRQMELPLATQRAMRVSQEQDEAARWFDPKYIVPPVDGRPAFDHYVDRTLPSTAGYRSTRDYLDSMGAVHGVDDRYGAAARLAVNNNTDIPPLAPQAAPDMDLGSDLWHQMDKSARGYENILKGRTGNLRNQNPDLARIAQQNIQGQNAAAATRRAADSQPSAAMDLAMEIGVPAAIVGGGAYAASQLASPPEAPASAKESTTADLAAESRPAPQVAATNSDGTPTDEGKFTEMFKRQYQAREAKREAKGMGGYADPSDKATAILADLNARRRKAGREVPEAAQMMADANRLIAMGNEQRNAPGYTPRNSSDPREQAQILLQKLNADRMEAGGEVPHSQQVLAAVRRLQAMGDQQRNYAQTR